MSRQVDVKALVSHIVRGDGGDKCRICMGDTTEGQVFLGDTVMLDGNKPVTLAELLETITGVAVAVEHLCPQGVCVGCVTATLQASELRTLVRNSQKFWNDALTALSKLPSDVAAPVRTVYAFLKDDDLHLLKNYSGSDSRTALNRLKNRLTKKKSITTGRKQRVNRNGPSSDCTDCGKAFSSPHYLNVHLQNSAQKEACLICGTIVIRGKHLKEHLLSVHGQTAYLCSDCPLLFPSEEEVNKHKKNAHRPGVFTCNDCGRSFPRSSSFEAHLQMHAVRTCRACGAQFANRGCYREHRSVCEPDAKPNSKDVRKDLRSNIRDPATFTCDYCEKTYHSRPQLKNHIIWIHMNVRPHQCQWCGKRFYTSARLAEHTIVHTRERNFACDICGARLVTKMAMVYHKRRHTGEKPYECEDCGEKFISASRRSEHAKRRHGKGTMFQCPMCVSHFVRGHELKKHMEKVHKNVPKPGMKFIKIESNTAVKVYKRLQRTDVLEHIADANIKSEPLVVSDDNNPQWHIETTAGLQDWQPYSNITSGTQ